MTKRAILALGIGCASLAFAQSSAPPPPPAVTDPSPPPPPPSSAIPAEKPFQLGPRFGGSSGIGAWIPGMISFHLFDLHGGIQVSPLFGAYLRVGYNASAGIGIMASATGASVSGSGAGMWLVGANAELGLGDAFFLAAGPQVGVGPWFRGRVTAGMSGAQVQAIISQGAHPGANFKIGVGLGQPDKITKRRTQFTLALDVAVLVATKATEGTIGASTEGVSVSLTTQEAVAVVPTLHLGFEWR